MNNSLSILKATRLDYNEIKKEEENHFESPESSLSSIETDKSTATATTSALNYLLEHNNNQS